MYISLYTPILYNSVHRAPRVFSLLFKDHNILGRKEEEEERERNRERKSTFEQRKGISLQKMIFFYFKLIILKRGWGGGYNLLQNSLIPDQEVK